MFYVGYATTTCDLFSATLVVRSNESKLLVREEKKNRKQSRVFKVEQLYLRCYSNIVPSSGYLEGFRTSLVYYVILVAKYFIFINRSIGF